MSRTNPLPLRDLSEPFNDLGVMLYILDLNNVSATAELIHDVRVSNLFGEALEPETGIVLAEVCARLDLPSEETSAERSVGDYCNSEVFGCGDD